jgi:chromosome segregation ATPase
MPQTPDIEQRFDALEKEKKELGSGLKTWREAIDAEQFSIVCAEKVLATARSKITRYQSQVNGIMARLPAIERELEEIRESAQKQKERNKIRKVRDKLQDEIRELEVKYGI